MLRLPTFEKDGWALESGEARHAAAPKSFWIPDRQHRESLRPGLGAKLIFSIQVEEDNGSISIETERMWVVVSEVVDDGYVGLLDNQPSCLDPDGEQYLVQGAEIPFRPEHVINTDIIPPDALERMPLTPTRLWPRF